MSPPKLPPRATFKSKYWSLLKAVILKKPFLRNGFFNKVKKYY